MKKERGGSLIETAMVIPLWIILCFGIVELSFIYRDYAAITQATHEALHAGFKFQCNLSDPTHCNFSLPLPYLTTPRIFDESLSYAEAGLCLNNNSAPDCGRIIMAWYGLKVFESMKKRSTNFTIEINVNNNFTTAHTTAQYHPLLNMFGSFQLSRDETGPYGVIVSP